MRKLARKAAFDEPLPTSIKANELANPDYLGPVCYTRDKYQGNGYAGVVTGLAWTAVGGEILFVESSLIKGKGEKRTLMGLLVFQLLQFALCGDSAIIVDFNVWANISHSA